MAAGSHNHVSCIERGPDVPTPAPRPPAPSSWWRRAWEAALLLIPGLAGRQPEGLS